MISLAVWKPQSYGKGVDIRAKEDIDIRELTYDVLPYISFPIAIFLNSSLYC